MKLEPKTYTLEQLIRLSGVIAPEENPRNLLIQGNVRLNELKIDNPNYEIHVNGNTIITLSIGNNQKVKFES